MRPSTNPPGHTGRLTGPEAVSRPGALPPVGGREVAASVDELVAGATARLPLTHDDGKSGARLERVIVAGQPLVLKHLGVDDDWVARASGDLACRPVLVWSSGLLDALPDCFDHAVVAAAHEPARRRGALLLRDVGAWLVPPGDDALPLRQHRGFLSHMAALHAVFWDFRDTVGLLALETRFLLLSPWVADAERDRPDPPLVPGTLIPEGWRRLSTAAPKAAMVVRALHHDPTPLSRALRTTPQTLIHGDWKAGNLGTSPDGHTVLLDWAIPGQAPACLDLAWYLAINAARLPEPKRDAIAAYRRALEHAGVPTHGWWERQLALSLLGAFLLLGWEKAFGHPAELAWWAARVEEGTRWLA